MIDIMLVKSLNWPWMSPQMFTGGFSYNSMGWPLRTILVQKHSASIYCYSKGNPAVELLFYILFRRVIIESISMFFECSLILFIFQEY